MLLDAEIPILSRILDGFTIGTSSAWHH